MPTAPKTYHDHHFKHLTYLLLFICHTLPTLNPSHPAALPDAQHLPRAEPPQETETKKRTKNRRPTGATARPVPTPPAARQSPHPRRGQPNTNGTANPTSPAALYRESGGTRRALPEPVSGTGREEQATTTNTRTKSIMKENCDIAIFVVRLIVAVRFPNTKVRTRKCFTHYGP